MEKAKWKCYNVNVIAASNKVITDDITGLAATLGKWFLFRPRSKAIEFDGSNLNHLTSKKRFSAQEIMSKVIY